MTTYCMTTYCMSTLNYPQKALEKYLLLDCGGKCQAMYVWIDGTGENLRGKTCTLDTPPKGITDLPEWNFDGSSTGQADRANSDCYLKPVKIFPDPFRGKPHILVLSEVLKSDKTPADTNHRFSCAKAMDEVKDQVPWFGMEQGTFPIPFVPAMVRFVENVIVTHQWSPCDSPMTHHCRSYQLPVF